MSFRNPVRVHKEIDMEASTPDQRRSNTKPVLESHLDLLREGTFSDVTFVVGPGNERIPCHQLFLKARSSVFEVMFSERWNQSNVKEVPLKDVDPKIFKKFLEYIYADTFVANVSEALELLQVADLYDVQSLVGRCEKLMENEVTLDDAVDVFQAARKYDKIQLMDKVGDLMTKSLSELQNLESFSRVDKRTMIYILKRDDLKLKEVDLFRLVLKWARNHPVSTMTNNLQGTVALIRFPLMTLNEFTVAVVPTGILTESTLVKLFTYFGSDAATKKSLARTLKFSTQPRKSTDSIVSVALYPGDIVNKSTRRQHFGKFKECLQFEFRTEYFKTSSDSRSNIRSSMATLGQLTGGNMTTIGLNGISIYCPARALNTACGMIPASFKEFKILLRIRDPFGYEMDPYGSADEYLEDLFSMSPVKVQEGKMTEIKFDRVVPLVSQAQYCICVEEIETSSSPFRQSHQPQSYDAKEIGHFLSPATMEIYGKPVSIHIVNRNTLRKFRQGAYAAPQLICKLSLEEY